MTHAYYSTSSKIKKNFNKTREVSSASAFDVFTVFFIGAIIGDSSLCNWNNANYRILRDITAFHHTLPHFTTLIFNIMFSRYDSLGARYQNIKSFHAPRHNFLFLFKFQISSSGQSQNF